MREIYSAFTPKTPEELKQFWSEADFTFDANVLLDLYNASSSVSEAFFSFVKDHQNRVFLTHQAGLEFYRNRKDVIEKALKKLQELPKSLSELPRAITISSAEKIAALLDEDRKNIENFLHSDPIETRINDCFDGRVESGFDDIEDKYTEIQNRYNAKIPPGFADENDKDNYKRYGDGVLWLQIIEHAKRYKKPVILVTSEKKYDWWILRNDKTIEGPRPELAQEIKIKAGVNFYLYNFGQFFKFARINSEGADKEPLKAAEKEIQRIEREPEVETLTPELQASILEYLQQVIGMNPYNVNYSSINLDSTAGSVEHPYSEVLGSAFQGFNPNPYPNLYRLWLLNTAAKRRGSEHRQRGTLLTPTDNDSSEDQTASKDEPETK